MKKVYTKPELVTKAYAQFENVFTACSKNPSEIGCGYASDERGSPNCHHSGLTS